MGYEGAATFHGAPGIPQPCQAAPKVRKNPPWQDVNASEGPSLLRLATGGGRKRFFEKSLLRVGLGSCWVGFVLQGKPGGYCYYRIGYQDFTRDATSGYGQWSRGTIMEILG